MLNFLGIGAQKAGTTWLYDQLSSHPDIGFPAGKEIHFWNARRELGIVWYENLFASNEKINGEITPAYAMLDLTTIRDLQQLTPDLRIIYLIRNPIDRAWSSARMALGRAEITMNEASDSWFTDHFNSAGSLGRGDYERTIRQWRTVFGDEAVLIKTYEELKRMPRQLLAEICTHIGVQARWAAELPEETLAKRVFEGTNQPIRKTLKENLLRIYEPRIRSLSLYLNQDYSHWLTE